MRYDSSSSKIIFSISFKTLFRTIHHLQENMIKSGGSEYLGVFSRIQSSLLLNMYNAEAALTH